MLHRIITSTIMAAAALGLVSCTDNGLAYQSETVVEAYLYVGEPIRDIRVYRTQDLSGPVDERAASVTNAVVTIVGPDGPTHLRFVDDDRGGHYEATDRTIRVAPSAHYALNVDIVGAQYTGSTTTPGVTTWVTPIADTLHHPLADEFAWQGDGGDGHWLVSFTCTDTTGGRLPHMDAKQPPLSSTYFTTVPRSAMQWGSSPWFGPYRCVVYTSDANLFKWFTAVGLGGPFYDRRYSSITGGIGVFGSASRVEASVIVAK